MQKRKQDFLPADTPPSQPPTLPAAETLDEHQIAELAYHHWINRGCPMGSSEEDWFLAEQDLRTCAQFCAHK